MNLGLFFEIDVYKKTNNSKKIFKISRGLETHKCAKESG